MGVALGRSLIASMNGINLSVTRYAAGTYVAGKYVPGAASTVTALATVQPLGGNDIMRIPEGDRTRERRKLYSADLLYIERPATKNKADEVSIDGVAWQVESIETWPNYWKVIVVRMEPAEDL